MAKARKLLFCVSLRRCRAGGNGAADPKYPGSLPMCVIESAEVWGSPIGLGEIYQVTKMDNIKLQKTQFHVSKYIGGRSGIRTLEGLSAPPVFHCSIAFATE